MPEPPEPWSKPLFATVEGPVCPQRNTVYGHIPVQVNGQSEDCLYLNIHVPAAALHSQLLDDCEDSSNGLPILVHIPGGGFFCGSGDTDIHGPEYLIPKNIIVLTFNYRYTFIFFLTAIKMYYCMVGQMVKVVASVPSSRLSAVGSSPAQDIVCVIYKKLFRGLLLL